MRSRALILGAASLVAVIALAGCNSTMPQQQAGPARTSADDPSRKCFSSLGDDPQLRVLHPKVGKPSDHTSTTLDMLSSKDRATEEEKKAIQQWAFLRNACVDAGKRFREIHQPPMYSGLVESQNERFVVELAKLYAGDVTYGEFNSTRKQMAAQNADVYRNALVQEQQANRSAQQLQAARKAQQAAEFNNAMILLQASRPAPLPVRPPVSCTSRAIGNTLQTDCF